MILTFVKCHKHWIRICFKSINLILFQILSVFPIILRFRFVDLLIGLLDLLDRVLSYEFSLLYLSLSSNPQHGVMNNQSLEYF